MTDLCLTSRVLNYQQFGCLLGMAIDVLNYAET